MAPQQQTCSPPLRRRLAERAYYWVCTRIMATVLWCFGRWEVHGARRMPRQGPLIVVSNHLHNADPPLLGASLPRRIHFMAKQELIDARGTGFFIRLFGAFPVRRDKADLKALRLARCLLAEGRVIGMFPEGHRSKTASLLRAHPGTALVALRSNAPLLPVAITGTERIHLPRVLIQRPRIVVRIGQPFTLKREGRISATQVRDATEEIMQRIAELLPPSYRGVYSGSGALERDTSNGDSARPRDGLLLRRSARRRDDA